MCRLVKEIEKEKRKIDAPIAIYEGYDVSKGKGRFGPFIKWNRTFINVNKRRKKVQLPKETDPKTIDLKKAEKLLKK